MKRHEATFTISGIIAGRTEIAGRQYILVSVERGQNKSVFRFALNDEDAQLAKGMKQGEQVLIQGALWGKKKDNGYFDMTASVDGLFIRAGHSRDDNAPASSEHYRAKANGYQREPESYTTENDDIPF